MISTLRQLRNNAGLQRTYVAKQLRINPDYLNRIERGIGKMDETRARKMSNLYGCSIGEIQKAWRELNEQKDA